MAAIDRNLAAARLHIAGQRRRQEGIDSAIRYTPPGFLAFDVAEHCGGPNTDDDVVHTLTATDMASDLADCRAIRIRSQMLFVEALNEAATVLSFTVHGVDSANDKAFMTETVYEFCKGLARKFHQ